MSLPSGVVTLLFTDIEGSTKLLHALGDRYAETLAQHRRLLRQTFERHGGREVDTQGDAFFVSFSRPADAVAAARDAQRSLAEAAWPKELPVRVRMGVHTGNPVVVGDGYIGLDVHKGARICSAAHGGQVVVSEATRRILGEDLPAGIRLKDLGSHRLKDLLVPERVFQLEAEGVQSEFPPLRAIGSRPNNLPTQPTTFVGRQRELKEIVALLERPDVRLLTLTGTGGTGKTRLALQAAAESIDEFADGTFLIALAPLDDATLVVPTVAEALHLRESPGQTFEETLHGYLEPRQVLLVLDNFEHLMAAADRVGALIAAAPRTKVLVTSRASLHIAGEHEYAVSPLHVPDPEVLTREATESSAVELFFDRATAVRPDLSPTPEILADVARICARLDGLPLAIELAAARLRALSLGDLLDRLERRLPILTGGPRDAPDRHRTLRETIRWSYALLDEPLKRLFARLAVFRGGFRLAPAEECCGSIIGMNVLDGVEALVDASLLRRTEVAGSSRFSFLEMILEYAHELLEQSADSMEARRAHAEYFAKLAEDVEEARWDHTALRTLDPEHDNLRAALAWSLSPGGDLQVAARLTWGMWRFWMARGFLREGREWTEKVLSRADAISEEYRAKPLGALGEIARCQGDVETALSAKEEELALLRRMEGSYLPGLLHDIGYVLGQCGEFERAEPYFEEALEIRRSVGFPAGVAHALNGWSITLLRKGELHRAEAMLREGMDSASKADDIEGMFLALMSLAEVSRRRGDLAKASAYLESAVAHIAAMKDLVYTGDFLEVAASVSASHGDLVRAAKLWGAADELRTRTGAVLDDFMDHAANVDHARRSMGDEAFDSALSDGRSITVDKAVGLVRRDQG